MNVRLDPQTQKFVSDSVASGAYRSASEMVQEGLLLLQQWEQIRERKLQALRRDIAAADEQFRCGQYTDYTVETLHELSDWVKKEGRKRLAKQRGRKAG